MKTFSALLFTGILVTGMLAFAATCAAQTTASYNDVLLIINDSSKNSVDIGNFFAQLRHVPPQNIFHIAIDTSVIYNANYQSAVYGFDHGETIDSATFKNKVWFPLENYMRKNNLVSSVNYIVTTKGCPLRVTTGDPNDNPGAGWFSGLASFNDCLALIGGSDSNLALTRKFGGFAVSRYYGSTDHFKHDSLSMPYYLTTRLDAYTVDQVKTYLLKADSTAIVGEGLFVLDVDPSRDGTPQKPSNYQVGNDWLRSAAATLEAQNMNVFLDTTQIYVTHQSNVIGYASWGSNDAHCGNYTQNAIPHNTYLNGAIGETYVSTGGRTFNDSATYGQSLIADWIAEGISGIKGYTDEPYLTVMAQPSILFPQYVNGFNMAESYWSASELIAWRQVVIGDPKMMLRQAISSAPAISLPDTERYLSESKQFMAHNTSGGALTLLHAPFMDASGDTKQFSVALPQSVQLPYQFPAGDSLPLIVTFKPSIFGGASGVIDLPYRLPGNNHDNIYQIQTSSAALHPKMASPDTLNFPDTKASDTSALALTIRNNSIRDTLRISGYGFTNETGGVFQFRDSTENRADTVFAGDSLSIPVIFIAAGSARATATLYIFSNASRLGALGKAVALVGNGGATGIAAPVVLPADELSLAQNYPNPFAQFTGVSYFIPRDADRSRVSLKVFDVLGRQVADLTPLTNAGNGRVLFSAAPLPQGTYFCRLSDGRTVRTISMLHVK